MLPQNSAVQAHVTLSVMDDRTSIEKVIKDLVADTFRNMQKRWVYLSTKTASPVEIYNLVTPVSKVSDLKRVKDKMKQLNFAEKVEIKGFKNKLLAVDIAFRGDLDELEQKLKLNQMRIESYGVTDTEMSLFLLTEISAEGEELTDTPNEVLDRFENEENQNNLNEVETSADDAHVL